MTIFGIWVTFREARVSFSLANFLHFHLIKQFFRMVFKLLKIHFAVHFLLLTVWATFSIIRPLVVTSLVTLARTNVLAH